MRSFVSTVCHKCISLWKLLYYLVVNIVKDHIAVYIAGSYLHC